MRVPVQVPNVARHTAYSTLIKRDPSLEQEVESATNESFGPASLGPGTAQPEVRRAVPGSSV